MHINDITKIFWIFLDSVSHTYFPPWGKKNIWDFIHIHAASAALSDPWISSSEVRMEKDMDDGASTVRSVRVVVLKKSSHWAKGIGLDELEAEPSVYLQLWSSHVVTSVGLWPKEKECKYSKYLEFICYRRVAWLSLRIVWGTQTPRAKESLALINMS